MAAIGCFLFALLLVLYALLQGIILGSFQDIEAQASQKDVERVQWALMDRLSNLNNMVSDWAPWDQSYAFVQDGNPAFLQTNMTPTTLFDLKLNLFAFADSSGKLVFGRSSGFPLPGNFSRNPWKGLLVQRSRSQKLGILLLPKSALLIAAQPIVTSKHQGPARGTLIMGRLLDASSISALSRSVRLALSVRRFDDPGLPADFKKASDALIGGSPAFILSTEETVSGYALWRDVERKPALLLRVDAPRTIYRQGLSRLHHFVLVLFAAGLVFGAAMLLILEKMLLARLARLNASVQEIGASGQLSLRVPVSGNDELSDLATAVNEMLSFLEAYDIEEKKQAEERIEHLAWHDALTDLPNRLLFQDRLGIALARALRYGEQVAVMMLDLDRFKEINNTLGHETGDQLLRAIAKRLMACVRRNNTVARMSGDEFFFILPDIRESQDAGRMAARILKIFQRPFLINGHEIFITPSIGISLYPSDGEAAESLMQNADLAMYQAKSLGKNRFQFFAAAMSKNATERKKIENDLRKALPRQEFQLAFQPQVDLETRNIVGMEALIRWIHPELGLISPLDFIPLAEEIGLIVEIGEWVLSTACARQKEWLNMGFPVRIAVNLSPRQFHQEKNELVDTVCRILEEHCLDPAFLELEITESIAMQNLDSTVLTLNQLHDLGVRLSIDDFGTGYSSLSYLKSFPIDTLKVDRAFVKDLGDPGGSAIVEAIVAMTRSLGLKSIAEGVETSGQLDFLASCGCEEIQGFFFSRPVFFEEATKLLREQPFKLIGKS